MNNSILLASSIGLILLFILAEVCGEILKIRKNSFYRLFHFTGGALTFLFFFSLIPNTILCLILTETVGVLWEIYEWIRWKLSPKKKLNKLERKDTIEDLILDMGGAIFGLLFILI